MKTFLKVFFKVFEYAIILGICLFVIISITTLVLPQSDGFLGYKIYTVVSESMSPELVIGDVILVKVEEPENINIGDIIVYQGLEKDFKDKIITHRVTQKQLIDGKYVFTTKGEVNLVEDPSISEDQINGIVIYKVLIPSLIKKAMMTTGGFIAVIVIPMVALMLFETKEIKDLMNKKSKKGDEDESDER